ncbi:hypothetical protein K9M16_04990 [Candidatus Babeliales bacterium]|nr:hypothetical protein [Candidatus Babeliales bacterium]MCF7910143.1 hypothetical protein [Candidatus Pacearchaeota archaeon]
MTETKEKKGLVRRATTSAGRIGLEASLTAGALGWGAVKRWPKIILGIGELLNSLYSAYDSGKDIIQKRDKKINVQEKLYKKGFEQALKQDPSFYAAMAEKAERDREKDEAKKDRQEEKNFAMEQARKNQMFEEIKLHFNILNAVGNLSAEMSRTGYKGKNADGSDGKDYAEDYFTKGMDFAKEFLNDLYKDYGYQRG